MFAIVKNISSSIRCAKVPAHPNQSGGWIERLGSSDRRWVRTGTDRAFFRFVRGVPFHTRTVPFHALAIQTCLRKQSCEKFLAFVPGFFFFLYGVKPGGSMSWTDQGQCSLKKRGSLPSGISAQQSRNTRGLELLRQLPFSASARGRGPRKMLIESVIN